MNKTWLVVWILACAASAARAQQFQQVGAGLPGPVVWSEGVAVLDADDDGRLDIIFANGVGFDRAGTPLAPTLLINQTPVGGAITFADETAARLPPGFVQQAKGVEVLDADGDGDPDLVFANAFGNQPSILINDGTGHFTDETATRFPAVLLNSFDAGSGDVDGDADLDLFLADTGPDTFGPPGGMARLFKNDGTGHFTNPPVFTISGRKEAMQNTHLVDVDDDLDLDLIVDGRTPGQKLYLNDGLGRFTYEPTVLPAGSDNTYATGWADLDNDDDLDGFYISLTGFNEGTAQNDLHPGGALSFTGSTATLVGENGDDDNDVVFLDANDDGFLDPIVGSLSNNKEKLYLNAGTFAAGSFVFQPNGFPTLTDSTLDLALGDFDDDGAVDVVTAQGESGNFTNRVYRNTGPADSGAPRIGRVQATGARVPVSALRGKGLPLRARIQDAVYQRGRTFVLAKLDVHTEKDGASSSFSAPMAEVGGGIHQGFIRPEVSRTGSVGMDVTWSVHARDRNGNASETAPARFRICGAESYGTAPKGSRGRLGPISALDEPSAAAKGFAIAVAGLVPSGIADLLVGTEKVLPGGSRAGLLVGGSVAAVPVAVSGAPGAAVVHVDLTRPPLAGLQPGETRYVQLRSGADLSDALEVTFCD
jgi:hypothetical protein